MDKSITVHAQPAIGLTIFVPTDLEKEFKAMVARSMATWQTASPAMRAFADKLSGLDKLMLPEGYSYKFQCPECHSTPCCCRLTEY